MAERNFVPERSQASRREAVKLLGASAAGVGLFSGIGSARNAENIYEQSLVLRRRANWDVDTWHEYLERRGLNPQYRKRHVVIPSGGGNMNGSEVGTQKLDKKDATFTYTYTYYNDFGYAGADIDWDISGGVDDYGEDPADTLSIEFSDDHYTRTFEVDDWVYYDEHVVDPSDSDSKKPNGGAVGAWKDGKAAESDSSAFFGVRIEPETGTTEYDRILEYDFRHAWEGGSIKSIVFGTGGFNVNYSDQTRTWDYEESFRESDVDDGETRSP